MYDREASGEVNYLSSTIYGGKHSSYLLKSIEKAKYYLEKKSID